MLSQEQLEFINGNLLGDGNITKLKLGTGNNSCFSILQKSSRLEYINNLASLYEPFTKNIIFRKNRTPSTVEGKINHDISNWDGRYTTAFAMYTKHSEIFSELRHKWYKHPYENSHKKIPNDLLLTWKTMANWMCDDGTNNDGKQVRLYTNGFQPNEVEFLVSRLKLDLSLMSVMRFCDGKPIIVLDRMDEVCKLVEGIRPYVTYKCFDYKLKTRTPQSRIGILMSNNVSGCPGVSYLKGWWRVYGRREYLGCFRNKEDAIVARRNWEKEKVHCERTH
jgi:hypothetical protein